MWLNSPVCFQLDILEFIHEHEYVHADVKASNLMLSHSDPNQVSSCGETPGRQLCCWKPGWMKVLVEAPSFRFFRLYSNLLCVGVGVCLKIRKQQRFFYFCIFFSKHNWNRRGYLIWRLIMDCLCCF